jgi:two-component system sensor histidine kinase KdpD
MERGRWAWQALGAVAGVAAVTVLIAALRGGLDARAPNLAPVYLLAVILAAVTWGWWAALGAVLLSFLAYNYYFVEPIHSFVIRDAQVWVELLVFLLVAAVTSNLAARERARREEARRRAEEASLLFGVSHALGSQPLDAALGAVAGLLRRTLGLRGCAILLTDATGRLEARPRASSGEIVRQAAEAPADWLLAAPRRPDGRRRWIAVRQSGRRLTGPAHQVPLRVGERAVGALRLVGRPSGLDPWAAQLLASVAEQLGSAIERERLRRAAEEAELLRRTDALRSALLSSVSHDLRTPLAAIKASAGSLLQRDVAWTEPEREAFAAAIDREADRLDRLVRNLLDMSRIEGGALRPRRDWFDLAELVREVVARVGPLLEARPVRLELAENLPPILIDYQMIEQVLTNLLENIARHTPPGTAAEVRLDQDEGGQRVCVVDHGPGIPLAAAQRVFDRFQRGDGPGRPVGTGLGLAVSRGFVEAHGGWLELAATEGGGATFCFVLPAAAARGGGSAVAPAAQPGVTGGSEASAAPSPPPAPAAVQRPL